MTQQASELVSVEQELAKLRHRLKQSFEVLDDLVHVQTQFEGLSYTHQQLNDQLRNAKTAFDDLSQFREMLTRDVDELKQSINHRWKTIQHDLATLQSELNTGDRYETDRLIAQMSQLQGQVNTQVSAVQSLSQSQETFNQRLKQLETSMESSWKDIRQALLTAHDELSSADRTLKLEMTHQVNDMQKRLDEQLEVIAVEWANQKESLKAPIEEFESRLRSELRIAFNRGFGPQHIDRLEKLTNQMNAARTAMRELGQANRRLKVGMICSILIAGMALSFSVLQWLAPQSFEAVTNSIHPSRLLRSGD
ncbi:MAG: hypothetical protein ACFE0I_09650 [Elainellaceae cyanobacterium]